MKLIHNHDWIPILVFESYTHIALSWRKIISYQIKTLICYHCEFKQSIRQNISMNYQASCQTSKASLIIQANIATKLIQ